MPPESEPFERPRVLALDLARLARGESAERVPWADARPWLDRLGCARGGALGLALLFARALDQPERAAALVISVPSGVSRGVPTAARASVASRAPLGAAFAEGLVGGDLGRRLASVTDALLVEGRCELPGAVLVIDASGGARVVSLPALRGASPRSVHGALQQHFGPCATLSVGRAGELELPIASLAAGGEVPHFVGRGGLGAVLGRTGLKAIAVLAEAAPAADVAALLAQLVRSPRLRARAEGGTLELFEAFHARGELQFADLGLARAATVAAAERERGALQGHRHGCQGCPTPCGWAFDRRDGARQGARFGASYALGLALGLERFEDSLALLADCDEFGLDAKEAGAGLALLCRAGVAGFAFGNLARFRRALRECVAGGASPLRAGSVALARELGLADSHPSAKGIAVRPDASLASLLGQCVSSRGGDPMRTFPFLAVDGSDLSAFRASTGIDLPPGAEDPRDPAGKGVLVAWHEDWANALDATGFCAFSAAALLADGVLDVDALAALLAPELGPQPCGAGLLERGATASVVQRRLNELWGLAPDADRPPWARAQLDRPGMWDAYARARGVDATGRVSAQRWEAVENGRPWTPRPRAPSAGPVAPLERPHGATRLAQVIVRGAPPGAGRSVSCELPATLLEVLAHAGRRDVVAGGRLLAAVFRNGRRLAAHDLVQPGDELDLVRVVAGG